LISNKPKVNGAVVGKSTTRVKTVKGIVPKNRGCYGLGYQASYKDSKKNVMLICTNFL
jgi:hypothetical protein